MLPFNIHISQITIGKEYIVDLIGLAVLFLILALIEYALGERKIAGFCMEIAKWMIIIFLILAIFTFFFR